MFGDKISMNLKNYKIISLSDFTIIILVYSDFLVGAIEMQKYSEVLDKIFA